MMKGFTIYRRLILFVLTLTILLALVFIMITYYASEHFYEASTQVLNKEVAGHIATFTSPFENEKLNKQKADSVFYNAMVISPSAEVYFLDTTGKILYYHANEADIKLQQIPLENIRKYIASGGSIYIKAPDPKQPDNPKIFSAAMVPAGKGMAGYIYVILGSKEYRNVTQMIFSSQVTGFAVQAFVWCVIIALLVSFIYFRRLQMRINKITQVLTKFQEGDFTARFSASDKNDMLPVTEAFNKMADLLAYNINKLSLSEKERKDLIKNISHDLRTPLSVARGYTETLLLDKTNQKLNEAQQQDYKKLILANIQQVEKLVAQLFELSKMESASFKPNKEPFIFSEIVQEIVSNNQYTASEKNIIIDCNECNTNAWILADIQMMERVIQNLLANAINYSDENSTITLAVKQQNNDSIVFSIENIASHFPAEVLQWLNSEQNEPKPAKSVIGLTIVKRILQLHQFKFEAKTISDNKITLSFVMPLYKKS